MLKCPGRWSGELERCKTLRYFSLAPSVWYPTKLQSDQAEGTGCWLLKTGDNWLWQLDSFFASGFVDRCDDGANCDFHIAFHSADMWRGAPVSRKMRKRTFQLLFVILLGMCSPLQGAVPPSLPQEKNHERNSHDQSTTKGHTYYIFRDETTGRHWAQIAEGHFGRLQQRCSSGGGQGRRSQSAARYCIQSTCWSGRTNMYSTKTDSWRFCGECVCVKTRLLRSKKKTEPKRTGKICREQLSTIGTYDSVEN